MQRIYYLIIFIVIVLSFQQSHAIDKEVGSAVGKYAPDFEIRDTNGRKVTLYEFRGKVVLINFWATYCVPCRTEMPSLNNLYLTFNDRGFIVVAITVNTSMDSAKSFIAEKKLVFPVVLDVDRKVYSNYAVHGLPVSFLINKKGVIVKKFMGEEDWDSPDIKNEILKFLR